MNTKNRKLVLRASTVAVHAALLALALGPVVARADDEPTVKDLTVPTNKVEVGVGGVSQDSNKAGEYDGLEHKGFHLIGNFDLRGGGAYDSNDATRWRFSGTDLGLETRDVQGEYGEQGKFRFNVGFDSLLRNRFDSYETPYQGAGGTRLTLPGNWLAPLYQTSASMASNTAGTGYPAPSPTMLGLAATSYNSPLVTNTNFICRGTNNGCVPTAANSPFLGAYVTGYQQNAANQLMLGQNLTDLNDFRGVNLYTKRDKYDFGVALNFSPRWDASASMRREDKTGLKELGVVNADGGPAGSYTGEVGVIVPQLIDHTTDQINAALNYRDEKSFFTVAYFGSIFTNHAKSMTIDNPYGLSAYGVGATPVSAYGPSTATITEEPDNTFNQLRLTGGYDLANNVKLVGDAAYARNAQNDPFILDPAMFTTPTGGAAPALNNGTVVPTTSANAVVITKNLDLKLTARPVRNLNLSGAYKYDDRENQTPVSTFGWYDAGAKNFGAPALAAGDPFVGATIAGVPTGTPIYGGANIVANRPYSKRVNQLDFDADYGFARGQSVKAGVDYQSIDRHCSGTWIDCSFADNSRETTGKLEYRFHAGDTLSGRLAGDYGFRHVNYNDNAWMSLVPALGASSPYLMGLAPGSGQYNGSILSFLTANGLSAYGLPLAANSGAPFTGNTLATYQALFGTGNGGLSNNFYANHNITDNWPGLDVYNMANRDRSRFRGGLDWQATERLSLQTSADYRHDKYPDSTYGLQSSDAWSWNLDGDYSASEDLSLSAYYTYENQDSKSAGSSVSNGNISAVAASATGPAYVTNSTLVGAATPRNTAVVGGCVSNGVDTQVVGGVTNPTPYQIYNNAAKVDPCNNWQTDMRDKTDTLGIAITKKRLFTPKLTLRGDVSYTRAVTTNSMSGGFYYASSVATFTSGVPAVYYVNAAALPDVVTTTIRVRLTGDYKLTKASLFRFSYTYANLHTNDYQYNTNQPATTSGSVMPDFETAPNYAVHIVGLSYAYMFQ
jgi:hypothetical protein